jgi:hypothetical protein
MPDENLLVPRVDVTGRWEGRVVRLSGSLTLEGAGVAVRGREGFVLTVPYGLLTDATWQASTLTLHRAPETLDVRGGSMLATVWARIVRDACSAPEVARGLRSLGTVRGGSGDLQRRFFGPLLLARRRLEEPEAPEWRLSQFHATELSRRLQESLHALAADRFPGSPPHRRALEAELGEVTEVLFDRLRALDDAAEAVRGSVDGTRFLAWRAWTGQLRAVFVEADGAWTRVLSALHAA